MITTPEEILRSVSYSLGEATPDFSPARINFFNRAYQFYLGINTWSFKIKKYTLTTTSSDEYDLTSLIPDYSQPDGVYAVKNSSGKLIEPVSFEDKDLPEYQNKQRYYITPDGKSIGFTTFTAGDVFTIYYYAVLIKATSYNSSLNIPIPEMHKEPIVTYTEFLIHKRKRQRNDARNCMLDFKDQLEEIKPKDAKLKSIGFLPKTFPPLKKIIGL